MPERNPAGVVIRTTRNEDSETLINNRQNGRRRGRGGAQVRGPGGNNGPDRGNRIDNRARGNAAQLHEKYRNLARDAQTQGDRVMTEYYLQFADHYFRVLNESRARFEDQNPNQQQRRPRFENDEFEDGGDDGDGNDDGGEMDQPHYHQQQQRAPEPRRDDRDQPPRDQQPQRDQQQRDQQQRDPRRQDREPRRRDRERAPEPAVAAAPEPELVFTQPETPREQAAEDEAGERRPRRGRRPRRADAEVNGEDMPQGIEIDRLPPAFAPSAPVVAEASKPEAKPEANGAAEEQAEPAPRRRRTRRVAAGEDGTVAA
jgi:hypothetical protein